MCLGVSSISAPMTISRAPRRRPRWTACRSKSVATPAPRASALTNTSSIRPTCSALTQIPTGRSPHPATRSRSRCARGEPPSHGSRGMPSVLRGSSGLNQHRRGPLNPPRCGQRRAAGQATGSSVLDRRGKTALTVVELDLEEAVPAAWLCVKQVPRLSAHHHGDARSGVRDATRQPGRDHGRSVDRGRLFTLAGDLISPPAPASISQPFKARPS
jgi:hypothetical protein